MTSFVFGDKVDSGTVYMLVILLLGIFIPSTWFFAYQLFKRRQSIPLRVRYPSITFWSSLSIIFKFMTSSIILLSLVRGNIDPSYTIYSLFLALDNIFLYLFLYSFLCRYWYVVYDLSWTNAAIQDNQWKCIINKSIYGSKVSWFLSHSQKTGKYVCIVFGLLSIVICDAAVLLLDYDSQASSNLNRLMFIILLVFACILYLMTPKKIASKPVSFHITNELKWCFIWTLLILLVAISGFVYDFYYYDRIEKFQDYNENFTNILLEESLYHAGYWLLVMFTTFYVLIKTGELPRFLLKRKRGRTGVVAMVDMSRGVPRDLMEVMNMKQLFDWFMVHLAGEFGIHNMCALIEFVQFQTYCQNYLSSHPYSDSSVALQLTTGNRIRLPHDAPQSDIVFEDNSMENGMENSEFYSRALEKSYKLYAKYINGSNELKVDLTKDTWKQYVSLMSNKQKWLYENNEKVNNLVDMLNFLDEMNKDVYNVLAASYDRFVRANSQMIFQQMPDVYMNSLT